MTLLTIRIEGGLLSPDFLETIHDQPGQKPADFGLDAHRSLVDEITAVWSDVRAYWEAFQRRRARARDGESLTSATREAWVVPLLEALGYRLTYQRRPAEVDGRSYPISHRATDGGSREVGSREVGPDSGPPVHIVAFDQQLGERPPAGRGNMAPHALVQDYLNRSDELWGIVTNGATLRLLRDSAYFSRPAYIEFDLQGMLEGERLDEFILFYRLAHRTRLPSAGQDPAHCLLERYHQAAVEQGGRIRDGLRRAVEGAILALANGFLSHPKNNDLRRAIASGELSASGYYQELLYLIYRFLFLMVAEERNLLTPESNSGRTGVPPQGRPTATNAASTQVDARPQAPQTRFQSPPAGSAQLADYYLDHYSITRLRRLAETPLSGAERFDDLYLGLRTLFQVLRDERMAPALGLSPLNGELFDIERTRHLEAASLNNRDLLNAIGRLSYFTPEQERVRRRVNYAALDVEELGSVYESLLDEYPVIEGVGSREVGSREVGDRSRFATAYSLLPKFSFIQGTERKTTGSYYTARELVKETLDSALDPIIAERLKAAADRGRPTGDGGRRSTVGGQPTATQAAQIEALLSIRVCDPACGSGHFLLAAARRIGRALAQVATGEDEPSPEAVRRWTREAIIHCIYGVDKNPLAVDLCKVALWIEGHMPGKPLTFLDAHIKCGDSLVGVFDLSVLDDGIPDEAFSPVAGDDRAVARELKRRNRQEREGQLGLALGPAGAALDDAARQWQAELAGPEDTPADVRRKQAAYRRLQQYEDAQRTACDLWTAAFFTPLTAANAAAGVIPTTAALEDYRRQPAAADPRLVAHARALAARNRFFHWPLEFPHVFTSPPDSPSPVRGGGRGERSGFTVVVGNPPWETLQLEEQQFFAARDPEIARLEGENRKVAIAALHKTKPQLAAQFTEEQYRRASENRFLRQSGRYLLTAVGKLNTYALFAELARDLLAPIGRAGIIVPTGIATDDTTKAFFGDLVAQRHLASLYDFENREGIFPAVDSRMKFSLLTLSRRPVTESRFVFFATRAEHLADPQRRFTLAPQEIALFNPNTRTMPVFRTRADAELTASIYRRVPVLVEEGVGSSEVGSRVRNPWGIRFMTMFHMANDSGLFEEYELPGYLPLYEAKMIWHFDHRFGSYEGVTDRNSTHLPTPTPEQYADPTYTVTPWYWVPEEAVYERLGEWKRSWLLGFRNVTNTTNERTGVFAVLPISAVGHSMPIIKSQVSVPLLACLLANLNSLALDYSVRQKLGGINLTYGYFRQFPILPPQAYSVEDIAFIAPRVLELVYTAWDMAPFAADLWDDADEALQEKLDAQSDAWYEATGGHRWDPPDWAGGDACPALFAPAKWDEDRRALLRAELDAYYARLYGLTRKQLRYILDPADLTARELADILDPWEEVADPLDPAGYAERCARSTFPGETFRVLKEKEMRQYGEYRTRRLVLEAWARLEAELGPAVARNYREEMVRGSGSEVTSQRSEVRGQRVAEERATYQATPAPPVFGARQATPPARAARPAEPDLFTESDSGRTGVSPQGRPAPTETTSPTAASTQVDARPAAPQPRPRSPDAPRPEPAAQPVLIPTPPQGTYQQRLLRIMELRNKRSPEAIGELVAALGDEDPNLRWLAAFVLQSIGGETVIATLRSYIEQAPSAVAREEAERVLGKVEKSP